MKFIPSVYRLHWHNLAFTIQSGTPKQLQCQQHAHLQHLAEAAVLEAIWSNSCTYLIGRSILKQLAVGIVPPGYAKRPHLSIEEAVDVAAREV